jgi:hypothetical protein
LRKSNAVFVTLFVFLGILILVVFGYGFVPYNGVVRITFDVSMTPYTYDYGIATFKALEVNFSRYPLNVGSNQTTKILSFPYGKLRGPLNMSLNLTLQSNYNRITLPTGNITFSEEGDYTFVYFHELRGIESGTYSVNLTYTESFRESFVIWASVNFYLTVE